MIFFHIPIKWKRVIIATLTPTNPANFAAGGGGVWLLQTKERSVPATGKDMVLNAIDKCRGASLVAW